MAANSVTFANSSARDLAGTAEPALRNEPRISMTMKPAAESRQRAGFGPIRFDSLKPDELRAVLESVGEAVESLNPNVQFRVDDSTGQLLTQIVDRDTGQVVRQIPTEEAVRALSRLNEFVGLLFDQAG